MIMRERERERIHDSQKYEPLLVANCYVSVVCCLLKLITMVALLRIGH